MWVEWDDQFSQSVKPNGLDRAALFGDGFFTTGQIKNGSLLLKDYHLKRIAHSLKTLMFAAISQDQLEQMIDQACSRRSDCIVRLNFSRVQTERGYKISSKAETKVSISLIPQAEHTLQSFALKDSQVPISSNRLLAGIKHLNRIDSVLAASQLSNLDQEAILYLDDQIICGSKCNLFFKINDQWMTPAIDRAGVAGVMRQRVMDLMDNQQISLKICSIERSQLAEVQAAFLTNCLLGIKPVHQINGQTISTNQVIQLKQRLGI